MDVEGYERRVLRGAGRTLGNSHLLAAIIEIGDDGPPAGADDPPVVDTMRGYGFEAVGYDPFARRLLPAASGEANTIFVRDRDAVARRVAESKRYRLINGEI
jgi:hypothetical protein